MKLIIMNAIIVYLNQIDRDIDIDHKTQEVEQVDTYFIIKKKAIL